MNIVHQQYKNKDLRQIVKEVGPYSSEEELNDELKVKMGGQYHTKQVIFGEGILGFHRFLQGYYLHYIVEKQAIAKIGRHKINEIIKANIIPLFQGRTQNRDYENKYREILNEYKIQNFYYSSSYDMTHSLAKNMVEKAKPFYESEVQGLKAKPSLTDTFYSDDPNIFGICQLFQFNYGIVKEFASFVKNKKWILSVVHGYCKQINDNFKGTIFNIIVIARRSRHHAGTRYIKRGIDSDGFVGNYVEVQQIVVNYSLSQDTRPMCSSFIQIRGSVPTYWMQRPSIAIPKPSIQIRNEDFLFLATRKHFHDLIGRYGQCIFAINLMKNREKTMRQSLLSKEYNDGIKFINKNDLKEENSLHYIQVDMKYHLKLDKNLFVSKIRTFAYYTIQKTGIFLCMGLDRNNNDQLLQFQNGVIRANCVDCLDRTNSFQQLVGQTVLSVQLGRLLKQDTKFQNLQLDQRILQKYSQLYQRMGDLISIQYGSSYAHKQKIQKTTESRNQFWTSIKRHFNNNLKDYDRQEQIDLFLGYRPKIQGPQLWEVKPSIQHYPSKRVKQFEKFDGYFQKAYEYFRNEYNFDFLKTVNNEEKAHGSWCHNIQQFGKEQLKEQFASQIVANLINQKQVVDLYRFSLTPKLILEKRVWTEMNPKPKIVQSLQEKLSHPYNKMDYLKNEGRAEKLLLLSGKKSFKNLQQNLNHNTQPKKQKRTQIIQKMLPKNNTDHYVKQNMKHFLFLDQDCKELNEIFQLAAHEFENISEQELDLIENTLKGELVTDQQIDEQLQKCYNETLGNQNELNNNEDICLRMKFLADEQIKHLQNNFSRGNYFGVSNKVKSKYNFDLKQNYDSKHKKKLRDGKLSNIVPLKKEEIRKDYIKDNRVLMLQQIMQDNFSHGKIKGKVSQI